MDKRKRNSENAVAGNDVLFFKIFQHRFLNQSFMDSQQTINKHFFFY